MTAAKPKPQFAIEELPLPIVIDTYQAVGDAQYEKESGTPRADFAGQSAIRVVVPYIVGNVLYTPTATLCGMLGFCGGMYIHGVRIKDATLFGKGVRSIINGYSSALMYELRRLNPKSTTYATKTSDVLSDILMREVPPYTVVSEEVAARLKDNEELRRAYSAQALGAAVLGCLMNSTKAVLTGAGNRSCSLSVMFAAIKIMMDAPGHNATFPAINSEGRCNGTVDATDPVINPNSGRSVVNYSALRTDTSMYAVQKKEQVPFYNSRFNDRSENAKYWMSAVAPCGYVGGEY